MNGGLALVDSLVVPLDYWESFKNVSATFITLNEAFFNVVLDEETDQIGNIDYGASEELPDNSNCKSRCFSL